MSTEADKLRAAKALIEDPKNWTTGSFARDAAGASCTSGYAGAVCWCARGAARRTGADEMKLLAAVKMLGAKRLSVAAVNDSIEHIRGGSTGHPAVMKIYDKAIELAEASQ